LSVRRRRSTGGTADDAFKSAVIRPAGNTEAEMLADSAASARGRPSTSDLDERAAAGEARDDLLGGLVEVEVDGRRLNRDEITNIVLQLVIAGLDTVVASPSCFLTFLGRHPAQRQRLMDDPSLVPGAVEELLRYESPVQMGSARPRSTSACRRAPASRMGSWCSRSGRARTSTRTFPPSLTRDGHHCTH
jgi:cytochrome P450